VLLDELFGRNNRLYTVTFKQGSATGHKSINPGCVSTTNFLLIYAKDKSVWAPNRIFTARERDDRYNQYIENIEASCEQWTITTLAKAFAASKGVTEKEARTLQKANPQELDSFVIRNAKSVIRFARPSYEGVGSETKKLIDQSKVNKQSIFRLERDGYPDIYLKGGERIIFYVDKLKNIDGKLVAGEPLTTLWDDILSNNLHAEGGVEFPKGKKPEGLIKRAFELATNQGDWVLDSFAGSGTTGAVAHKMGRRWILVELGEHCDTHVVPRLKSVIDGTDASGITEAVSWKGGGGFRYYYLAPSLLKTDKWGNLVINKEFNADMLSQAVCKLEGYTYAPSDTLYWQHGRSSEKSFIYVTTQHLTREQLTQLNDEVGPNRSLLICCSAFRGKPENYPYLEIKKIPKAVLAKCEWGHDDYSLNVENLPKAPPKPGQQDLFSKPEGKQ
jgi:adenine-specific DNA-methyltransferase